MKKLLQHIRMGEALEVKEAVKKHGRLFASMNEAFGALAEEQAEAIREEIEEHALLAACEYVQVAAVARKALRTLIKEAKNHGR